MLHNIFNIFEPFRFYFNRLTWNIFFLGFFFFLKRPWVLWDKFYKKNLTLIKRHISIKRSIFLILSLRILLFFNIIGLIPWVLCNTSHIRINGFLALAFWIPLILWEIRVGILNFCTHITPKGAPFTLRFFLVVIETISKFIQPLTLSLRLTANIIAGHIIISLLRGYITILGTGLRPLIIFILITITCLEIFVALIQAYVFFFLLLLYAKK